MTSYTLRKGNPATTRTDAVVIGVHQTGKDALKALPGGDAIADAYGRGFGAMLRSLGFEGSMGQAVRFPASDKVKAGSIVVVGFGKVEEATATQVRHAAAVAARNVSNASSVTLALPATTPELAAAAVDGFRSGSYRGPSYGKRAERSEASIADVVVLADGARRQEYAEAVRAAEIVGASVDRTRDWANEPPNLLSPASFADRAVDLLGKGPVEVTVLDEKELADLGCGGILGVGSGSANPPRLVKMHWKPKGDDLPHVALVGKGITYDSGGLTIKPGGSMSTMKFDMAGAAAVINTMHAIAELDLPIEVTAFAPMAENMVGGSGMRPGDVLSMYDDQTVEVTNTDAEGRLILADALAMAAEIRPDAIAEISTLTGPCVVALGDRVAGVFALGNGTDGPIVDEVRAAAERAGELVWHLPVTDHTRHQVTHDSKVADVLQHNWVRWGSASFAAAFLMEFAGEVPFFHLDIAGPAWNNGSPWQHVPSGATGFGVATLVEWARERSQSSSS